MNDTSDTQPRRTRETVLRLLVLGTVYAMALGFVVALSPSAGLIDPHAIGEIGRVAQVPAAQR